MKLLKTKAPKEAPTQGLSLAERINAIQAECNALIDARTQELKNSPDGALLPFGVLRQEITRHVSCVCRATKALLDKDTGKTEAIKYGEAFDE